MGTAFNKITGKKLKQLIISYRSFTIRNKTPLIKYDDPFNSKLRKKMYLLVQDLGKNFSGLAEMTQVLNFSGPALRFQTVVSPLSINRNSIFVKKILGVVKRTVQLFL